MLKVTLIQSELVWQNIDANLAHFTRLIDQLDETTDLIVLPEMFTTGFSMEPETFAEGIEGRAMQWMKNMAILKNVAITGSVMYSEEGKCFNKLVFMFPDGNFQSYNKKHLFSIGDETNHYTAGNRQVMVEFKEYKIFLAICYDLRFPAWLRRTAEYNYDVMLLVANWPERRSNHWKTLIQARAIENQAYVIAVNRIGNDGNDVHHSGDSALINAKGELEFPFTSEAFVKTFTINKEETQAYRNSFNTIADADTFNLEIQ